MSPSRLLRYLLVLTVAALSLPSSSTAQVTTASVVNQSDNPLLRPMVWRSIGPAGQGGRVDDIAVDPHNPFVYYVGFATGGLWKTVNNGTTFTPIFDEFGTHSVGAIGIAPSNTNVVYVGTGESNNRQSASFGAGVYKSTDGGASFTFMGLAETQSIARVVVHPSDPNTAWVAANGHLFGANPERGVFKTTDGGATWTHVLRVDENTGATDLIIKPDDPTHLMAATYQRRRSACCFVGGGEGSGIWVSSDGGDNWGRMEGNGLPTGTMGRIALATTAANPNMIYAQIEVAADKASPLTDEERSAWVALQRDGELPADQQWNGVWRSTDGGQNWQFRSNENGRPMYFSQIRVSPSDPDLVYTVDQQVAKSRDGGQTWETLDGYGHVDQHALWINPTNHDHIMIGNDGSVDVSYDQGETWESLRTWAVGQPYHASVDMARPYNVCTGLQDNGSWCGPSSMRTGNILAQDWFRSGGGDGFYSQIDPTDSNIIYSESQNGNVRRTDLATGEAVSIRPRPAGGGGGDGVGNIVPAPDASDQIRWNWNTPILLSPHNPSTVYVAGNRFFTSRDRGDTWTMSADLTKSKDRDPIQLMGVRNDVPRCTQLARGIDCNLSRNDGVNLWSTGVSIAESPLVPGVFWMGTDDGNIQVSRDGGATWTEVSNNLPGGTTEYYVSRVEASHFDPAAAYVSIDGHRSDDLKPYVYATHDYGATWTSIAANLPEFGNVNTVRQDPRNVDILYAGTEFGFFISGDEGKEWHPFMNGLPVVRIDDVLVHPRDNDLVLATHGRSVYVMDDMTALQDFTTEILAKDVHLFEPREAIQWRSDPTQGRSVTGDKNWTGESAPTGSAVHYYLSDETTRAVSITIADAVSGEVFRTLEGTGLAGLNRVQWNLRSDPPPPTGRGGGGFGGNQGRPADPGVYRVTLSVGGEKYTTTLRVLEDVWMN
ncbi:MAG: hypothetical protein O2992_00005 [Gemmatimonadetes bacterium]|nr:hypothetical protein [Gemmatimonadota bacterium]